MSVFAGIMAKIVGGAAKADGSAIGKLGEAIDNIIVTKNELKGKELDAIAEQMQGQMEVNKIEAAHPSVFVAGWRPFTGWSCGFILVFAYGIHPILTWILAIFSPETIPPPQTGAAEIMPVLLGMLGIGGLRTYEKLKKRDTKRIK